MTAPSIRTTRIVIGASALSLVLAATIAASGLGPEPTAAGAHSVAAAPASATRTAPTTTAPPATVAPPLTTTTAAPLPSTTELPVPLASRPVPHGSVFAIGDSVMLDAAPVMEGDGVVVDAAVGRQFSAGVQVLRADRDAGRLPPRVVVHLGTNGPITDADVDQLMDVLAGRQVVLVTMREPRFWESANNALLAGAAARWPDVRLADWHTLAAKHGEWFYADGIHLTPAGAVAYARLVEAEL